MTEDSPEGHEESNLDVQQCKTNRNIWFMGRRVYYSRTKWPFTTFKSFKLIGPNGIMSGVLQHGIEYLVSSFCHLFSLVDTWIYFCSMQACPSEVYTLAMCADYKGRDI
jgi:hypothetical protein